MSTLFIIKSIYHLSLNLSFRLKRILHAYGDTEFLTGCDRHNFSASGFHDGHTVSVMPADFRTGHDTFKVVDTPLPEAAQYRLATMSPEPRLCSVSNDPMILQMSVWSNDETEFKVRNMPHRWETIRKTKPNTKTSITSFGAQTRLENVLEFRIHLFDYTSCQYKKKN